MRRRSILGLLTALLAISMGALSVPRVTLACSCVDPAETLGMTGDDPTVAVFTGEAGLPMPAGIPVTISRWFLGPGAAEIVTLDVESMAQSSCGTGPPPAGHEYLFKAQRTVDGRFSYHACTLAADLGTGDGQAMLAKAITIFGDPLAVSPPPASPGDPSSAVDLGAGTPLLVGGVFAVGVVAGLLVILRRRSGDGDA